MQAHAVADSSQVAAARRAATERATALGFDATQTGNVAIVATELCTNILKHGGGGELLVGNYQDSSGSGLQLIALDKGHGIADMRACVADGFSSTGTAGHGLGAIHRLSHITQIASWPSLGTAVLARFTAAPSRDPSTPTWGAVAVAMPGEDVCGDAWIVADTESGRTVLVADGLGHGPQAATAALEAVRLFARQPARPVPEILAALHAGLRPTRGAAVAIARFERARATVTYGGIGNITGAVLQGSEIRRMISMSGTAGHNARKVQSFDYRFTDGLVIMATDGIASSWSLERYPGLLQAHPVLIAAVLYRDFGRRRDDATVVVARPETAP